jgi:chromosome partitioning protein
LKQAGGNNFDAEHRVGSTVEKRGRNKMTANQPERAAATNCQIVTFAHHKGGTGKTTSCLNIAGWLAKMGKRILVVDMDPQGNATAGLGVDRETVERSVYDALFGETRMRDVILETDCGVHLAPSSLDLLSAEARMAGRAGRPRLLRERLAGIKKYYDFILIDVPPGSTMLMINGIAAARRLVVPMDSGVFASEAIEPLVALLRDINGKVGIEIDEMTILLRKYSSSVFDIPITRKVQLLLQKTLEQNHIADVRKFLIPFSGMVFKAQMKGLPISHYAPMSRVGKAYKKIALEIMHGNNNADG